MPNSEKSDLTQNLTAFLTVDCGDRKEKIGISRYPKYSNSMGCAVQSTDVVAHPSSLDVWGIGEESVHYNLFTSQDITMLLQELRENIRNVLQATLVNEKQRKAVEEIVGNYFQDAFSILSK